MSMPCVSSLHPLLVGVTKTLGEAARIEDSQTEKQNKGERGYEKKLNTEKQ